MRLSLNDLRGPTTGEWKLYYQTFPDALHQDMLELILAISDQHDLDVRVTGVMSKWGEPIKAIINGREVSLPLDMEGFVQSLREAATPVPQLGPPDNPDDLNSDGGAEPE
jgi:hypothetical protein